MEEVTLQVLTIFPFVYSFSRQFPSVLGSLLKPRETEEQDRHALCPVSLSNRIMTDGSVEPSSGPGSVSNLLCGLEQIS